MFYDLKIIGQGNIFFDVLKKKKMNGKCFISVLRCFFFPNKAIIYLFAGYDDDSKFAVSRDSN